MSIKINNKLIYLLLFLFFLFLFFLSPISGDDWGNYLVGKQGIRHIFGQAFGMYFTWEGRLVSRIFINILTFNKWLWNIANSLCITGIIFFINKMINPTNKKSIFCLTILTILLMNIYTFSQVVVWIAGNITYLFPLVLILYYLYDQKKNKANSKFEKVLLIILNIITPMFVEHMAVLLILINISILIIKYLKNKKIDYEYLIYTILSIVSTLTMLLSPGTALRNSQENLTFNALNIFSKMIYNLPNFVYYTFIINSFLLLLNMITGIYQVTKLKVNNLKKVIISLIISVIPLSTIIIYNISQFITLPNSLLTIINQNNLFIQFYWFIYLIVWIYLIFRTSTKENRNWNLIFIFLGILANSVMLISPTWGYRTGLATYIFLMIPTIQLFSEIPFSKSRLIETLLTVLTIIVTIVWLIFYINIGLEQNNLEQSIKDQLKEDKEVIEIESFPSYANCNINPTNQYHLESFKEYYQIPNYKEVILLPSNWRYVIIK